MTSIYAYTHPYLPQPPRSCLLTLERMGVAPVSSSSLEVTLLDDGDAGEISFVSSSDVVAEDAGHLEVRLARSAGSGRVGAQIQGAVEAVDVTFEDGVLEATALVPVVDDDLLELGEGMALTLASPSGGATVSGSCGM